MNEKKILGFFALIVLILVSFYFDIFIVQKISLIQNSLLDEFFLGLTFLSTEIIVFFFLTSLFLWSENKRRWILPLWITLGLSAVISFVLKLIVQRQRPFQQGLVYILPVLEKASHLTWNFSFPSFQSMLVFSAVPILSKEFPRFRYVWIIFAFLVAFSRVYFGVHFLSDVLVGGLIGYLIGLGIIGIEKETMFGEKTYKRLFRK